MTKTVDEMLANRDKRPRYPKGARVQIVFPDTTLDGWVGEVVSLDALQNISGFVLTYVYRLRMDNLAMLSIQEESLRLAPEDDQADDQTSEA